MRDYQPRKNPYHLPGTVYGRVIALVRDYPRMCAERDGAEPDCGHRSGRAAIRADIAVVEKALAKLPQEYRQGVMDNIIYRKRMLDLPYASERTWQLWRARFLCAIAKGKRWI